MNQLVTHYRALHDIGIKLRNSSYAIADTSSKFRSAIDIIIEIKPNLNSDSQDVYAEMKDVSENLYEMYSVLNRISELYGNSDSEVISLVSHLPDVQKNEKR